MKISENTMRQFKTDKKIVYQATQKTETPPRIMSALSTQRVNIRPIAQSENNILQIINANIRL